MTTTATSRYFELSPTDRAMTVLSGTSGYAPQLALELDATLDASRLERALACLTRRHPILAATVDSETRAPRWRPATGAPELVDVREGEAARFHAPLDVLQGPSSRLVHVRTPEGSRIVLGAHHAVADGRSLALLLDDLRRFYVALGGTDQPVVDVDWHPRSIGAALDARSVAPGVRRRIVRDAVRRWQGAAPSTHLDPVGVSSSADVADEALTVTARFGASELEELDQAMQTRGWRRNHVLLALLARAWSDVVGRDHAARSVSGWLVAVDARRQLDLVRGIGNLSGFEPVALVDVDTDDVVAVIDAARRRFEHFAQLGAGMVAEVVRPVEQLAPAFMLDRAIRDGAETRAATARYTRCYSNLGTLPDELADWDHAHATAARWEPGGWVAPPFVVMMLVTFGGTTTLTPVASTATLPEGTALAVIDRVRSGIDEVAARLAGSVPERNAGSVPARNAGSVPERNAGSVPERNAGSVPERNAGSVPERKAGSVPERQTGAR